MDNALVVSGAQASADLNTELGGICPQPRSREASGEVVSIQKFFEPCSARDRGPEFHQGRLNANDVG